MPVRETRTGAVLALSAMANEPVLVPVVVGVKDTLTVQPVPTGTGDKEMQLSVSEKSPLMPTLSTVIVLVAVLVRASCWGGLDVPMFWVAKVSEEGAVVSIGFWTVTGIEIWRLCDPNV